MLWIYNFVQATPDEAMSDIATDQVIDHRRARDFRRRRLEIEGLSLEELKRVK